jgi:hypothetical protein
LARQPDAARNLPTLIAHVRIHQHLPSAAFEYIPGVPVTSRQWTRRVLMWRGSFSAITTLSILMLLSALVDRLTQ